MVEALLGKGLDLGFWILCGRQQQKMKPDARFSFPDRRHSFYSEVYPGVSVPSRLISCPSSLPVFRGVSRGVHHLTQNDN